VPGEIPGLKEILKRNGKIKNEVNTKEDKQTNQIDMNQKIPPIIYISNKSEDGFEGEVLADFYKKFP
jgi:GTPase